MRRMAGCVVPWLLLLMTGLPATAAAGDAEWAAMVKADWAAQELRAGREMHDPAAIEAVLERGRRLIEFLGRAPQSVDVAVEATALEQLSRQAAALEALDHDDRAALYWQIRQTVRTAALKNPQVTGQPIVFLKRRRFLCQMLHEYLAYFSDYGDISGGGVYCLETPGRSPAVRNLIGGRLPRGNYTTLALSHDARTIYFAFAERAAEKPSYDSPRQRRFAIYSVGVDGEGLRRLTSDEHDDFDPCPLPDGRIAFMSTRRGGFGRCHNPWEPLPVYTLHRMDADGGKVTTLSFHETNEWHPSVLHDGRIVYSRWDYVDRSAAHHHGLWVSHPDGTRADILFGNYTGLSQGPNACFQPRAVPGSRKILFVAGAHHAAVGGALVLLDPARVRFDPASGEDCLESLEVLTPEVCFPEVPTDTPCWPSSYFHSPWPLSEDCYLAAFSFHPLPGMGPKVTEEPATGIYYFDRFGNLELLYRDSDISSMYPVPLTPRPVPPVLPSNINAELGEDGELILSDVYRSLMPLPEGRKVTGLRIFQVLLKTGSHVSNDPRIGYARSENARMLLGTVPVEADGSARFLVPACRPLYFQAIDARGRAVQTMRSEVYLQAGERRGCVGCHEPVDTTTPPAQSLAMQRPPSTIEPGPPGTLPMSFPRLVQPIIDRHCIACHDGGKEPIREGLDRPTLVLTRERVGTFTQSYEGLRPFVRWYEWGPATIGEIITRPGQCGADLSPLTAVLAKHADDGRVNLSKEEQQRLSIWLDGNAPFYGTYDPQQQQAQFDGELIRPPTVQ